VAFTRWSAALKVVVVFWPLASVHPAVRYNEPRVLVPVDHRLADKESITLDDIADEPLPRAADPAWDTFWRIDLRPDGRAAPGGPLVDAVEDKIELVASGQAVTDFVVRACLRRFLTDRAVRGRPVTPRSTVDYGRSLPSAMAATTSRSDGFTSQLSPTCTVGTVSLPDATARTAAAASWSCQMFNSWNRIRRRFSFSRSLKQNGQPGRV
jgi:hypothetical protein